ncbi:hypothetical protein [Collimonas arenae]|uniref:hypothetical protein n=1 Tax=Collimonas arenae TaxID=279058 RepID=UPI00056F2A68|nr:hypothetical protein [Collimonas arenae]
MFLVKERHNTVGKEFGSLQKHGLNLFLNSKKYMLSGMIQNFAGHSVDGAVQAEELIPNVRPYRELA